MLALQKSFYRDQFIGIFEPTREGHHYLPSKSFHPSLKSRKNPSIEQLENKGQQPAIRPFIRRMDAEANRVLDFWFDPKAGVERWFTPSDALVTQIKSDLVTMFPKRATRL